MDDDWRCIKDQRLQYIFILRLYAIHSVRSKNHSPGCGRYL